MTVNLLSKLYPETRLWAEHKVHEAVVEVMKVTEPWADKDANILAAELQEIFLKGTEFSRLIRRQRACWSVRFPFARTPETGEAAPMLWFDPDTMVDESGEDEEIHKDILRQKMVEIVVCPALVKRGNLDGEHFDAEFPVLRASVIMKLDD